MKLFDYQENCLLAIESDPSHSQLISMPTGTGKTITFLTCAYRKQKKCLILVHRNELLDQTQEKAYLCGFDKEEVSIIKSDEKGKLRRLNIAMVQTLARNLDLYDPNSIDMIIVDEAHHSCADSYKKIFEHFKIFSEKKILLGFTATPLRGDKKELGHIYNSHSFKMTLSEATIMGHICPVRGLRVDINSNLEKIKTVQGDYDIQELEVIMNCDSINRLIANKCENLNKTPGIIFCTSVDHSQKVAKFLREKNKKAISVSYLTPKTTLNKIFNRLKEGKVDFITNAIKLSEGFDFPPIQSIVLARPTRSPVLYKQMIGRGLRKYEKKLECLVIEFSGNDEKMINWEDIDENCTFQTITLNDSRSRKEALEYYRNKFKSLDTKIIDVRISPFKFYECNIFRFIKYKDFFYSPNDQGFVLAQMKIKKSAGYKFICSLYGAYVWSCCWKEKFKSFYVWSEAELSKGGEGCEYDKGINYLKGAFFELGGGGRWYPSDEENTTRDQLCFFHKSVKMSSRKAEMHLEDISIKQAIQKYFINSKPEIMPEEIESTHSSKVMELSGKY